MSARETAIAALHALLQAALAARSPVPQVLRNETVPQRLPRARSAKSNSPPHSDRSNS